MQKAGKTAALITVLLLCCCLGIFTGWKFHENLDEKKAIQEQAAAEEESVSVQEEIKQEAPAEAEEPQIPEAAEEALPPEPVIPPAPESKSAFVKVQDYIPDIVIDLKYAGTDNFTGQQIYDFTDAYLRYGTVEKLMRVQEVLKEQGYCLKIWDAFRPAAAQFVLWEVCPNAAYVANPNNGFSSHSRGNTVDITLVDKDGQELEMPTGFDDFSALADRYYADCPETAANHAILLENVMQEHGFKGYSGEWWHFSDTESYPVEKEFTP